jgi:hypothetical protein
MTNFTNADLLIISCPDCHQTIYIRLHRLEDGVEGIPIATDLLMDIDELLPPPPENDEN